MGVPKQSAYEEARQKRLEENRKRMEELNLTKLSQSLHTPKPSPMKKLKPRVPKQPIDPSSIRRSGRNADKPPVSYKDVPKQPIDPSSIRRSHRNADKPPVSYKDEPIEPLGRRPRTGYSRGRRDLANRVYANDEDREYATKRAEDLQSGLDQDFPSFVKPMLQSHVTGGFWLGLPHHLCKNNLPSRDVMINLVDENGEESECKYLAQKNGLIAGWRGFAIDHELVDGDALVFQLTDPSTFKVYIIRVNKPGGDGES